MKRLITLLFVVFFCCVNFSFIPPGTTKDASVKWGPELEGSKRGSISGYLGHNDNAYFLTGYEKSDFIIRKITKTLNDAGTYVFEEKDKQMDMKFEFEGVEYYDDQLFVFKSNIDKDAKKKVLYYNRVSTKTMQATGKTTRLSEINYEKKNNSGAYSVRTSRNDACVMVICGLPYDKESNEKNMIVMCDSTLKVLWKKTVTLPYMDKLFTTLSWSTDDKGNAYCLGKEYKGKAKEEVGGKQNFQYHIIAYTNSGEKKTDYAIKLGDKFVNDIGFIIGDDGNIICSGFYSKQGRRSTDGAFFLKLDAKTQNVLSSNMKEFDVNFITEGLTEKETKKAEKKEAKGKDLEVLSFDIDDILRKEGGGYVTVGEQFFREQHSRTDSRGNVTTYYVYYFYDIVVINMDDNGKIEWVEKIPKRQASTTTAYSGYALVVNKDKLRFIFNDHKENLAPKKQGGWKNFDMSDKNGIAAMATIDMSGKVTREALFNDRETEVYLRPAVCSQVDDDQLLLFGEKKKTDQFALVTFK
jgi:hypothetical protein